MNRGKTEKLLSNFKEGAEVEVRSDEDGFRDGWFEAIVIYPPSKSPSKRKRRFLVEYLTLVEDEGASKPLREYVDASNVRPRPPIRSDHSFDLHDVVDAYHNDGWWRGVITMVVDNSRFFIFFPNSNEELEFLKSDLRVHLVWKEGEWFRPKKQVDKTVQTPQMSNQLKSPHVACDEAKQEQPSSVINLGKKTTIKSTLNKEKSPYNAANSSKKKVRHSTRQWESELSRPNKKLKKEETSKSPFLIKARSLFTAKSIRATAKDDATPIMGSRGRGTKYPKRMFDGQLLVGTPDQEKRAEINPQKVESIGKETVGVGKKRGRPPGRKKQIGDIDASIKGQNQARGEEKVDEVSKAQIVSKEADMSIDGISISTLEEQRLRIEQFDAPTNSSGSLPDNQSVSQPKGEQCNESKDGQVGTALLSSATAPTCNDVSVENLSLPFVKSLPIWETIESMKLFHLLPQKPHFRPLDQSNEVLREGLAFGFMTAFASLVQKTSELRLDNPRCDFDKILDALVELGTYGFNVQPVIKCLNELLKIKDRQGKLMDKSKAIESEIIKWKDENVRINEEVDDITENISKLEETLRILRKKRELTMARKEKEKELNEASIATLQMQVGRINRDILDANLDFVNTARAPW
ncbi:hypothetical protein NE237_016253 [Protea cynaroides]|uniref:Agenet domain-containing protein n=1 Tax=Protea cynaroides TaxID=273540 RepID=A0A9Q0QRT9_9MAGN|nr:hypothetical protein NE237_016253 [Protea cynaroides]